MKKTLLFFVLLLLMIGAYGCNMNAREKRESMVTYINTKYTDDKFEFVCVTGGHWGSNTSKILVRSEKYPEKKICVICKEIDGELVYSDTYLNVKYEEETNNHIKNKLTKEYGENVYFEYIPDDSASAPSDAIINSFEDYISSPDTYVYFYAVVVEESDDETEMFTKVRTLFDDSVIRAHIYFVTANESLENNGKEIIEKKTYKKSLFIIKDKIDSYKLIEWVDGYGSESN